ncbi:Uncharacterised protein [Pseudomonas aeruginosa]|nr:Uncharacterised protein [Pseudomonas aeruginosa]
MNQCPERTQRTLSGSLDNYRPGFTRLAKRCRANLTGEGFFRIKVFVKASWRHANLTHDLGEAYFMNTMQAKQLGS